MPAIRLFVLTLALSLASGCSTSNLTPPPGKTNGLSYLALGDSYTIGRAVPVAGRWPVQLANALTAKGHAISAPRILARSGWTSADLLSAMRDGLGTQKFDLVSVLIGVNDQFQGRNIDAYRRDLRAILRLAIAASRRGRRAVFVLSIPDYGATPYGAADAQTIGRDIDRWNTVCRALAAEFKLTYFDITGISRQGADNDSLIAYDRLHPSAAMYRLWVNAIAAQSAALLEN